jgi:hypothetical protein
LNLAQQQASARTQLTTRNLNVMVTLHAHVPACSNNNLNASAAHAYHLRKVVAFQLFAPDLVAQLNHIRRARAAPPTTRLAQCLQNRQSCSDVRLHQDARRKQAD